ncbi:MAG: type 4a pilus biogenesis protein PilO [Geobacteraceae bacterium]
MRQSLVALYQRKKPWLIVIVVLLLLNISAIVTIKLYQTPRFEQKKELVTEQRKGLDALGRGDENSVYLNGKRDLEKLRAMIPAKRQFAPLLAEIMDDAAKCHVSSDSLTYKPEYLSQKNLLVYHISLSVSGRYADIRCYLYKIQTRKELVVIDAVLLKNEDPYAENVSMDLTLTTYLRDGA